MAGDPSLGTESAWSTPSVTGDTGDVGLCQATSALLGFLEIVTAQGEVTVTKRTGGILWKHGKRGKENRTLCGVSPSHL